MSGITWVNASDYGADWDAGTKFYKVGHIYVIKLMAQITSVVTESHTGWIHLATMPLSVSNFRNAVAGNNGTIHTIRYEGDGLFLSPSGAQVGERVFGELIFVN